MSASNLRSKYAQLQYYLREKLWRHAQTTAGEVYSAMNDFTFLVWKAYALDREGQTADALREYKACELKRGVTTAALIGMQLIYQRNDDKEALQQIEDKLRNESERPNFSAIVQAACMLWHAGDASKAKELLARVLDQEPDHRDEYSSVMTVRGWIDLTTGRSAAAADKSLALFDKVLQSEAVDNLVDIDATLGKVAVLERKNQFWPAQELLNKCLVAHRNFVPAMIIKARQLVRIDDWDQAAELVTNVLLFDSTCVEAQIMSLLYMLVKEHRLQAATRSITDLIKSLQAREPRNGQLYLSCAQCFSRLAPSYLPILTLTTSLSESAAQLLPGNSDAASEVAFQSALRGDLRTAQSLYKKASTLGDGSVVPLVGLIQCAIQQDNLQEASKQLEFLNEIQTGQQRNPELLYLGARLAWLQKKDVKASIDQLDRAVEAHRQEYASTPAGLELFIKLNPHFVLGMAKEYSQHCRMDPGEKAQADPHAEKTRKLLDQLLRVYPGCVDAQLLNSRMAYAGGDMERALSLISAAIRQDKTNAEAHLLQASIYQYMGNTSAAAKSLDAAHTQDFGVKDSALFNLLRGTMFYHQHEYDSALQALKQAVLASGGVPKPALVDGASASASPRAGALGEVDALGKPASPSKPPAAANKAGKVAKGSLTPPEHVSLFLQLAQTYVKLRDPTNATQTIRDGLNLFAGSPHVHRLHIAQALLLSRQDAEQAFSILRAIPSTSPHFLAAKAHLAQLYLSLRGNRRAFARCYEEVVEAMPSAQSFMHLGDAYVGIQEPDKAIIAYEKARAMDPNNAELSVKIGRTHVTTHDYQRALKYYKDAVVAEAAQTGLRADLAGLYWRLGDIEKAISTIRDAPVLRRAPAQDDLNQALERVQLTLLQAKIFKDAGMQGDANDCLIQARVFQSGVVTKARNASPEVITHEKGVAANICLELGDAQQQRDPDRATQFYTEALKNDETNTTAMLKLARIYLGKGEEESCEMQCNALLRVQPSCEEAIVTLANLMFRRGRFDDAAYHFQQLLDKQPENYTAMAHYVSLLRRSGNLKDAPKAFEAAEKAMKQGHRPDPGLSFAKGVYHKWNGNSREALTHLNLARHPRSNPWSQKALVHMVDLYVNPDGTNLWEDAESRAEVDDNLQTAEKLVRDVEDPEKRALLEAYVLMASKKKESVQRAATMFQDLNESRIAATEASSSTGAGGDTEDEAKAMERAVERMYVPAVVGLAVANQIMKATSKARTYLKRLTKPNYNSDEEDDFERGYLLLASIYIENGKFDLAQNLLNKAIAANKSCCRAWELLGLIYEKEQSFRDASDCYENAWRLMGEKDPGVGFKLAFNYLKAKRNVQAIDVCHKVLGAHPAYPKIKKEVLERARAALRP